jgi:hypothetical protein
VRLNDKVRRNISLLVCAYLRVYASTEARVPARAGVRTSRARLSTHCVYVCVCVFEYSCRVQSHRCEYGVRIVLRGFRML